MHVGERSVDHGKSIQFSVVCSGAICQSKGLLSRIRGQVSSQIVSTIAVVPRASDRHARVHENNVPANATGYLDVA